MPDSILPSANAPGNVDQKKLAGLAKEWGKLPEKERTKAMLELTRDMPARHREVIENYIKKISQMPASSTP